MNNNNWLDGNKKALQEKKIIKNIKIKIEM